MYSKIIVNDFVKNKLLTLTMTLFVAAAALLVSLASMMTVQLFGSLNMLMEQAKTPHFMQMHAGELDRTRLNAFADGNRHVDQFQIVEFLNIEGSSIAFGDKTLENSVQDNGLAVQNRAFDFLIDLEGHIIDVADGEIYVPVMYLKDQTTKLDDTVVINGQTFTVAGFIRDSIMNASLSTSKRFLVSDHDYEKLKPFGNIEYLIEFRLNDTSKIGEFEAAYANAALEMNGPTVTYTLFKLMNVISDGLLVGVIFLVCLLVVAITLMCIRFSLLAKVEEDYREIGVMKAIGLSVSTIKKMYLAKYTAIAVLGSLLGFALSFAFKNKLLENIRLYMGESEQTSLAYSLALLGIVLVILSVLVYVNNVLNLFKKISTADALRLGTLQEKSSHSRLVTIKNKHMNINMLLGIKDVLARKKMYATLLVVLILSSFIIIVPQNLYSTIASKSFISYMGIGQYDVHIQIPGHLEKADIKLSNIVETLSSDQAISKLVVLKTHTFKVKLSNELEENIKIELGDHSIFPIQYISGKGPVSQDDIALSALYADEMSLNIGDTINIVINGKVKPFTVSGIYSDITNGGKTAKAVFDDHDSVNTMWTIISVQLFDQSLAGVKAKEFAEQFNFAKVADIENYIKQTFGSTISAVKVASYAALTVAIALAMLVIVLFMNMLVAKDSYSIAIMKAIGFTSIDIKLQYITRAIFILLIGIIFGTLLANTLGEAIAGLAISSFGATAFKFNVNPITAYLLTPLVLLMTVLFATMLGIWRVSTIKISEHIKE